MNKKQVLRKIAKKNPELIFLLANLEGKAFSDAVFEIVGQSQLLKNYFSLDLSETLSKVKEVIGDFKIEDRVHWKASRDTIVLRLTNNQNKNFRLWWWKHADNFEIGTEALLYNEAIEITILEMEYYR